MPDQDDADGQAVDEKTETSPLEADSSPSGDDISPVVDQSEKRIRDLQSKFDAETARANKAEAALKSTSAGKDTVSGDPATAALMQELREASLDAVYGEFPELKQYGIDRSLVDGSTRAEMREAATLVVGLIKSLGTKVRNEVLAEHNIVAEPAGSTRKPPVNFESMNEQDFLKLLDTIH